MKFINSAHSMLEKRFAVAIVLFSACASILSSAQQRSLQIIPDQSTARVFLGTAENPTSFDVGVAKIKGDVQLGSDNSGASRFNLTIYAADHKDQEIYGVQSVITFQSERVEQQKDGKLEVHGGLTVTQVFGKEAPSQEGSLTNPKQLRTSQEVMFVVNGPEQPASASDMRSRGVVLIPKNDSEKDMLVTASMSVNGETFPQLLLTIYDVVWPLAADDESGTTQSPPDQDHRGGASAGAMSPESLAQSEAKEGNQQSTPAGNLITIQLRLVLTSAGSDFADGLPHTDTVR